MIPLILGAIAVGSAVFGGAKAIEGISDMEQAKEIGEEAQKSQQEAVEVLEQHREATNDLAAEYGQLQMEV